MSAMNQRKSISEAHIESAQQWEIGTQVLVTRDDGSLYHTRTRSKPWLLGGHTWVIMVVGINGAYSLERIRKFERHE